LNKDALRKIYQAKRHAIAADARQQAAMAAATLLIAQPYFSQSEHIACYLAYRDEFVTEPLIQAIWQARKICYLPVITPDSTLQFVRYDQDDPLLPNRYSILEPQNQQRKIKLTALDIIITPLVAFDRQGHRLGTGGGYYDKTLAGLRAKSKKPLLLGLGHAVQEAKEIPVEPWDVMLDGVITELEAACFIKYLNIKH
jgi:5-formyltetrahydrofolate cyclo-ligase